MIPVHLLVRRGSESDAGARGPRTNVVALLILFGSIAAGLWGSVITNSPVPIVGLTLVGVILMQSPKIAQQWERAIVLRLGRYSGMRGAGLFWIVPFVDTVTTWIDQRTITTSFAAEQTLTSDTVPVNVDAVLFWMVHDAQKAALEVQDYAQAVSWAAQTALRDIIGRTDLTDLLRGREKIEQELQILIDARSTPWGVTVQSVEMRDVVIPAALQDAMSRQAQAAREKQARIILGQAEMEIANSFREAAKSYRDNPTALHLRAMNMLYEGLKEKGALMLIPSSAVESMGMGGLMGAAALQQQRADGRRRRGRQETGLERRRPHARIVPSDHDQLCSGEGGRRGGRPAFRFLRGGPTRGAARSSRSPAQFATPPMCSSAGSSMARSPTFIAVCGHRWSAQRSDSRESGSLRFTRFTPLRDATSLKRSRFQSGFQTT